mmetsp:Transcript_16554/g.42081  ORF Transcript_16554/g.42081 Transcript_16554/m.42081 type:complete len:327 (-) Transcript_16554:942-1922(-)
MIRIGVRSGESTKQTRRRAHTAVDVEGHGHLKTPAWEAGNVDRALSGVHFALGEPNWPGEQLKVVAGGDLELAVAGREGGRDEEGLNPDAVRVLVLDSNTRRARVIRGARGIVGSRVAAEGDAVARNGAEGAVGGDGVAVELGLQARGAHVDPLRLGHAVGAKARDGHAVQLLPATGVRADVVDATLHAVGVVGVDVGRRAPAADAIGDLLHGARRDPELLAEEVDVLQALLALLVDLVGVVGGGLAGVDLRGRAGAKAVTLAQNVRLDEVVDVEAVRGVLPSRADAADAHRANEHLGGNVHDLKGALVHSWALLQAQLERVVDVA